MKEYIFDSGHKILYRNSDKEIIREVLKQKAYLMPGFEIKKNSCVIDIGANIGTFSVYAGMKAAQGKIFCYEPENKNFLLLKKNIKINKLKNVYAFKSAVFDKRGRVRLFIGTENSGLYSLYHSLYNPAKDSVFVDKVSLKEIFNDNKIKFCDLLKIDAEGAEYDILKNLPQVYFKKIRMVILEYHNFIKNDDYKSLARVLNSRGFKIEHIVPDEFTESVGLIFARQSKISKNWLVMVNYHKCLSSGLMRIFRIVRRKYHQIMGSIGGLLKKYKPSLYTILKKRQSQFKLDPTDK